MEQLLFPILIVVVFYFLLIRPQQKRSRQIAETQSTITPGARVMTNGGLIGTIVAIEGDEVLIEVAPGVTNRYVRGAIMRILDDGRPEQSMDEPSTDEPSTRPADGTTPGSTA
ncbi:MAG TPA: preprotein translocase subunit YajC [Jiangellaceae bacterium]|nr:preprotein translocase subunit YajC [Jiangellaceae bacterium]